jgi:phosphotransferase system HPr-like phosphotransfer protein
MKKNIKLLSINDVKNFVNAACAADFDIDLVSGRYIVDAKSIMGIFSLDLSKPIELCLHTDDEAKAGEFLGSIKDFII